MLSKVPPPFAISAAGGSVSSGSVVFSNSNGVSFGMNGSTVTGSVAPGGGAFSAGGGSSTFATLSFSNANGITFTNTNGQVGASYTVPTVPAQLSVGDSTGGNTVGNTGLVTGQLVLAGGNNITLSGSTNGGSMTLTISGANVGGAQTGISSVAAAGGTQTVGMVSFANSNGITFGMSTGANTGTMTASVAAQSNQTVGLYGSSQTTGSASSGTYDARSITFIGAGIVSVGDHSTSVGGTTTGFIISATQSNQAFSAQGGSSAFQTLSFTNSNNVSFSNTGGSVWGSFALNVSATGGTSNAISGLTFKDSNGVSFGISTGAGVATVTATVQTNYLTTAALSGDTSKYVQNWKLTGNTAGTTSSAQGTDLWISGGANVTVSGSSNTIVISGGAGGAFSAGVSTGGNTSGNTGVTGTRLVFVGSNNITLSQATDANGGTITISGKLQSSQPATAFSAGISGGNTSGNTGTVGGNAQVVFAGGNNITLSGSTDVGNLMTITISAFNQSTQSAIKGLGASNTGNTAGNTGISTGIDWVMAGTGALTVSQSTTAGGPNTLWFSGATVAGQPVNFSAGTTSNNLGSVVFSNSNGMSFGLSGSTITGQFAPSISIKSTDGANTNLQSSAWSFGDNNVPSGIFWSLNGNTISAVAQAIGPVGVGFAGNSQGNVGPQTGKELDLYGTGAISLSQDTNATGVSITFNVPVQTNQTVGLYVTGNSTVNSSTTLDARSLSFNASTAGAVSMGYSNGSILVSAPQTSSLSATGAFSISTNGSTISMGVQPMDLYAVGNTFGTTSGTADLRTVSISGGSGIQVAASNSGWVVGAQQISQYGPFDFGGLVPVTNSTLGQNSLYFQPFDVYWPISASRLNLYVSVATGMSAGNSTGRAGYTISAALYSRGTGASTDRISSFWSMTAGMSATQNSNTQLVMTNLAGILNSGAVSTVGTTLSTSNATTYMQNSVGGYRVIPLPLSTNLTPGRYWLAVANSTTSSNAGVVTLNCSVIQVTNSLTLAFRPFGTSSAASNASFYGVPDGQGTYSATSGGFPGSVPLTSDSIRMGATNFAPYFNISGYTNVTNAP